MASKAPAGGSMMNRVGFGVTLVAALAVVVIGVYLLLGVAGVVQIATAQQVTDLLSAAVIAGIVALVLSVIAVALTASGFFSNPRRLVSASLAVLLLLLSAAFLFGMALPRASAISDLNDNVLPFAQTMKDSCNTPLTTAVADVTKVRDHIKGNVAADDAYPGVARGDALLLRGDSAALATGLNVLVSTTAPAKYDALLKDCITSMQGMQGFLSNPGAIPLPAPFATAAQPSVSGLTLLALSAQVVGSGTLPPGTVQPLVLQAFQAVVDTKNPKLTAEGDALKADIKSQLSDNLAPFKVTIPVD